MEREEEAGPKGRNADAAGALYGKTIGGGCGEVVEIF